MLRSGGALNALLLLVVVMCALSVVTSQHRGRKLFIELQKGKEYAQQMEVEWGQLQLEQSTWAAPARVEKIASRQLQMQLPRSEQIQFVQIDLPVSQSAAIGGESEASNAKPDSHTISYGEKEVRGLVKKSHNGMGRQP